MLPNFSFFAIVSKVLKAILFVALVYLIYIFINSTSDGGGFLKNMYHQIYDQIINIFGFMKGILNGDRFTLNSLLA